MIRRTFLLAALVSTVVLAADTNLLSLVPADAKVAGGVQVSRTVNSPFGQYVLAQMGQNNTQLQEFIDLTGFDPRRDLQEIVFASTGEQHGPGVLIARGVFNGPQIVNAIRTKSNAGTVSTYRSFSLYENKDHSIAIADGSLAIAGQTAMVRAAIDRRAAGGTSSSGSALAVKAAATAPKYDAWMVTDGLMIAPLPGKGAGQNNPMGSLQGIVETSGGLTFGTLIQFSGEAVTRSAQDAQALVDVVKFLTGMMQMNANNPEVQRLQPVFDSLKVTAAGTSVKMSFTIPQSDLEHMVQPRTRTAAARSRQ